LFLAAVSPFTKIVLFDERKEVAHGMGVIYGRVAIVPVLAKLFDASLYGMFDLGNLITWKSSLIFLDYI
jgi:hypothetical protein